MDALSEAASTIAREKRIYDAIENELEALEDFLGSHHRPTSQLAANAAASALENVKKVETKVFHAANKYQKAVDAAMPAKQEVGLKIPALDDPEAEKELDRAIFWHVIRKGRPEIKESLQFPRFEHVMAEEEHIVDLALRMFGRLHNNRSDPDEGIKETFLWLKARVTLERELAKDSRVCEIFILLLKILSEQQTKQSHRKSQVVALTELVKSIDQVVDPTAVGRLATEIILRTRDTEESRKADRARLDQLLLEITSEFVGLPNQSSLFTASKAAQLAIPQLWRANKLANSSNRPSKWLSDDHQPLIEVELPADLRYHSIFVCPIMKDDNPENGPPVLLPCKHIISKNAMRNLVEQSTGTRRCPYCPSAFFASQTQEVAFI